MRSLSVLGGCALIVAAAAGAAYISGDSPFRAVMPVLIVIATFFAVSRGLSFLRSTNQRQNDGILLRAARLFDSRPEAPANCSGAFISGSVDGRESRFLFWSSTDSPPDLPNWAVQLGAEDLGQECAFAFRIACSSPVAFLVKEWGILPGPPFRTVKLDAGAIGDEPVDFTTKWPEAFSLWREREDCRRLAQTLILECHALQIAIGMSDITIWWPADAAWRWSGLGKVLPNAVEAAAELARALDGKMTAIEPGGRKCARCDADLGRAQAFCTTCGAPWWGDTRDPALEDDDCPRRHKNSVSTRRG